MGEKLEATESVVAAPPLYEVHFGEWMIQRCSRETPTTVAAVRAAYSSEDFELLSVYDRLLGGHKNGAWIKHIVKTVRKNPDLGSIHDITVEQLAAYADMRKAISAVIYGSKAGIQRDLESEFELYVFAVQYPQHVTSIIEVMLELKTTSLSSVQALLAERRRTHSSLVSGVL